MQISLQSEGAADVLVLAGWIDRPSGVPLEDDLWC